MKANIQNVKVGELRPSQILYAYGVGAVVDLPNISVMVLGLDDWDITFALPINEERLLAAVKEDIGVQVDKLIQPPIPQETDNSFVSNNTKIGIPVAPFPSWVLCPHCRLLSPLQPGVFTLKTNQYRSDKNQYVHSLCSAKTPPPVIPARFLVACNRGHLDDFPWLYFVHSGKLGCNGPLRLIEYGVSGAAVDIEVTCDACPATRRMSEAFGENRKNHMPRCRGRNPHLRNFSDDECQEQMQGILLGATNSWFPISMSALSIPSTSNKLGQIIEKYWTVFEETKSIDELQVLFKGLRALGQLPELAKYSVEDIWFCVEDKHTNQDNKKQSVTDLKLPEWKVFSNANIEDNTSDFRLAQVNCPENYEKYFSKVLLVERLREVSALIGFTRIESPLDFEENHDLIDDHWASLSRTPPKWVPATEVRGEGIFIQFSEEAITDWQLKHPSLSDYEKRTHEAHTRWRRSRNILPPEARFPGLRYLLLHSFSHALMRQLAIECGYTAASIRERIYSRNSNEEGGPMAGILIYTAAPDSEGTLGGLVNLGRPTELGRHIEQALEQMHLCAADPLCAEHDPIHWTTVHWASCHACLFSPETSCERGNKYLDRALLVPTIKDGFRAFFE